MHVSALLKFSFILLFTFSFVAKADAPENAPPPTLIKEVGKPITVKFADGREAVVKTTAEIVTVRQKFIVADNTCTDRQNMTCEYRFTMKRLFYWLVWSVHPDATKLNQVVLRGYSQGPTNPVEMNTDIEAGLKKNSSNTPGETLPPQAIVCDDFSFLPGRQRNAPQSLEMARLDSEDNVNNSETGVMENRVSASTMGLELIKTSNNELTVKDFKSFAGYNFDLLLLTPSVTSTIVQPDGQVCQTNFASHGYNDFLSEYEAMEKRAKLKIKDISPYTYSGDQDLSGTLISVLRYFSSYSTGYIYQ